MLFFPFHPSKIHSRTPRSSYSKLFVVVQSTKHTRLDVMTPDGRGPHYQITEERFGNGPISLLPHHDMEHLLWTDFERGTVSYTDFKGEFMRFFSTNSARWLDKSDLLD